jgi:hypothetical protein
MLKNFVIALGIAALTSGSAFAAAAAPKKATTHVTHKVAQAGEAKPAEGKVKPAKVEKAKPAKVEKADKKIEKTDKKIEKKEAKPAETTAAPTPAKK